MLRFLLAFPALLAAALATATQALAAPLVITGEIRGPIGPASASYFQRVLDQARESKAELVVVSMDTPGGLDTAMREMIQAILASPVPVALYVAPRGARAASAGTYLLYASHIAAMAPGTNVGAATPVAIGIGGPSGGGGEPAGKDKNESDAKKAPPHDAMESKAIHDATAYLRSLAQMRGRNVEWAEKAVVEADSLSALEAQKLKVIDLVAADIPDLLKQVDGRTVEVATGKKRLALADATLTPVQPNWKEKLLATIANPNIALLLMAAGVYGLLIEFYTPGTAVPGVIGAISLLLALYGLALLPINLAGVGLLLLGLGMMVAEAFLPSFGALGVGGIVAFVAGALLLIDADIPGFTVSWGLVVPLAVGNAVAIFGLAALALRSRRRPVTAGAEAMIGQPAEALEDIQREGWVRAHGERWKARTPVPMRRGDCARIKAIDGLTLVLEPAAQGGQR